MFRGWPSLFLLMFMKPGVSTETGFFTVCSGDRQLADSEEMFAATFLRAPLKYLKLHFY